MRIKDIRRSTMKNNFFELIKSLNVHLFIYWILNFYYQPIEIIQSNLHSFHLILNYILPFLIPPQNKYQYEISIFLYPLQIIVNKTNIPPIFIPIYTDARIENKKRTRLAWQNQRIAKRGEQREKNQRSWNELKETLKEGVATILAAIAIYHEPSSNDGNESFSVEHRGQYQLLIYIYPCTLTAKRVGISTRKKRAKTISNSNFQSRLYDLRSPFPSSLKLLSTCFQVLPGIERCIIIDFRYIRSGNSINIFLLRKREI